MRRLDDPMAIQDDHSPLIERIQELKRKEKQNERQRRKALIRDLHLTDPRVATERRFL